MMKMRAGATERAPAMCVARTACGAARAQKNFHRDGSDFPPHAGWPQPKLIVGKGL